VVPVAGNGDYTTALGFTPTLPGTYQWVATYSGDANNEPASTSCGDDPVVVINPSPAPLIPPSVEAIRVNKVYDWVITNQAYSITFNFPQLSEEEGVLEKEIRK
jgi:hypothetical protein